MNIHSAIPENIDMGQGKWLSLGRGHCSYAAHNEHLQVLKWALTNDCPVNEVDHTYYIDTDILGRQIISYGLSSIRLVDSFM
jgi:hypothetical protein